MVLSQAPPASHPPRLPALSSIRSTALLARIDPHLSMADSELNMSTPAASPTRDQYLSYWQEHTGSGTIEAMMLDSQAKVLDASERPEILGYLPSIEGMKVMELGAGMVRGIAIHGYGGIGQAIQLGIPAAAAAAAELSKQQAPAGSTPWLAIWRGWLPAVHTEPIRRNESYTSSHSVLVYILLQGRFTPWFAEHAREVLAVDFVEASIEKNKTLHADKYPNTQFLCADVTTMSMCIHCVTMCPPPQQHQHQVTPPLTSNSHSHNHSCTRA